MRRTLLLLPLLLLAEAAGAAPTSGPWAQPRVRDALRNEGEALAQAFRDAGAAWPPRGVLLRAFKMEGDLELWAAPPRRGRWVLVRRFPVCVPSGVLGPKRREGDLQVPEGFYFVDRFNPRSRFHMALGIDYPNAVDRHRAGREPAGSAIMIHGGCASIGCLPLRDAPMEALYVATLAAREQGQARIPVHVFPCRFDDPVCRLTLSATRSNAAFWAELEAGWRAFETRRVPPTIHRGRDGHYRVVEPAVASL